MSNILRRLALLSTATLVLLAPAAHAQLDIQPALLEGDEVVGVGFVTRIDNLAVNDDGEWIVEVDTDNANTDIDGGLVKNGMLFIQEGQALAMPVGASVDSFDTVNLNNLSDSGWNLFLDGTMGTGDDSGVYFNTTLVIQESFISTAPEFSPDTPYIGFFETKINDSNQILIMASVDDVAIESSVDRALVVVEIDEFGNLLSESVFAKEADVLPGQTEAVTDFGTSPHEFDYNDAGDILFQADLTGDTTRNAAVYLNDTLLAQEGGPSPVAGRNWSTLTSIELSSNNLGETVFSGSLDGDTATNGLIVKNGAKFVQEGDTLPDIDPFVFTSFGSGPILISDGGDVLWYGDWDDANTDVDTGLFLNDELIVQEGVTMIGGQVVDTLRGIQDGYAMSDDGRFILFEAVLADGTDGAFLITRDSPAISVDLNVDMEGIQAERTVVLGEEFPIQLVVSNTGGDSAQFDTVILEVFLNDTGADVLSFGDVITLPTAGDLANLVPSLDAIAGSPVVEGDSLQLEFPPAENPPFLLASGRAGLMAVDVPYELNPGDSRVIAVGKTVAGITASSVGTTSVLADNVLGPPVSLDGRPVGVVRKPGTVTVSAPLELISGPLVRGTPVDFTVTEAIPGETVFFLRSTAGQGDGACFQQLGGLCLDIVAPIALLGTATADAAGTATLTVVVPGGVPIGLELSAQAVAPRDSESTKSNAITEIVQ